MTKYYFAYGSNMSEEQMKERCNYIPEVVGIGKIRGYIFVYNGYSSKWGGATADIIKTDNEEDVVWGVVYEISENCEKSLDEKEGFKNKDPNKGTYKKIYVCVDIRDGSIIPAYTYIKPDGQQKTNIGNPSDRYRNTIVEAARKHGLPEDYIKNFLERRVEEGTNG
ncbi:MAG: gamma-glutamylcyclotransferase family protein [Brevinematia bacterium]